MKSAVMGVFLAGVVVLGVAAGPGSARATVLPCGGTVGPGGTVVMSSDILFCADSLALTVVGPVVVDMAGHTVSCSPAFSNTGIFVEGKGAVLKNGMVRDCSFGVLLAGVGSHQLLDMDATSNSNAGILVAGAHNFLSHNNALDGDGDGFQIFGTSHVLSNNVASNNSGTGFFIEPGATLNQLSGNIASTNYIGFVSAGGQGKFSLNLAISNIHDGFTFVGSGGDQLVSNTAARNGFDGFLIEGPNTILNGNRAFDNVSTGITLDTLSAHSLVNANIAVGNGVDLIDENVNCGTNTWIHNIFGIGAPGCVHWRGGTVSPCGNQGPVLGDRAAFDAEVGGHGGIDGCGVGLVGLHRARPTTEPPTPGRVARNGANAEVAWHVARLDQEDAAAPDLHLLGRRRRFEVGHGDCVAGFDRAPLPPRDVEEHAAADDPPLALSMLFFAVPLLVTRAA
jgi:parallel beta-helix repeat protein